MKLKSINDATRCLEQNQFCSTFITFSFNNGMYRITCSFQRGRRFSTAIQKSYLRSLDRVRWGISEIASYRRFRHFRPFLFKDRQFDVFLFDAANLHFNWKSLVLKLGLISVRFYYDFSPRYRNGFELARSLQRLEVGLLLFNGAHVFGVETAAFSSPLHDM